MKRYNIEMTYGQLLTQIGCADVEYEYPYWRDERMPYGKYKGVTFIDLIHLDRRYFEYIKNSILNEILSMSEKTCIGRIKMLDIMLFVEQYEKIERYEREYERRQKTSRRTE